MVLTQISQLGPFSLKNTKIQFLALQTHKSVKISVQLFISKWNKQMAPGWNQSQMLNSSFPDPGAGISQCLSYRFKGTFKKIFKKYLASFSSCLKWERKSTADCVWVSEVEVSPFHFLKLNNNLLYTAYFLKDFIFMTSISSPHTHKWIHSSILLQWFTKNIRLKSSMISILLSQHNFFSPRLLWLLSNKPLDISLFPFLNYSLSFYFHV